MARRRMLALALAMCAVPALAQQASPPRPKITGISHVGFFVSDLPKAMQFWQGLLGYDQYFALPGADGKAARIVFLRVNDHQHIELFTDPPAHPPSMLSHICFTVDHAQAMKDYLRSKGVSLPAGPVAKTKAGDLAFEVSDPDGTLVEFVEPLPGGVERRTAGHFDPPSRISTKIYHLGFLVGNTPKAIAFYHGILGFEETWRGSPNTQQLSWINMRVPDGTDYVEFMLYAGQPSGWGTKNHIALSVPDVAKAVTELESRPAFTAYGKPLKPQTGINQKRQVNLYDPDGTRVELMEENTITGKQTPSSTAPVPPPAHD